MPKITEAIEEPENQSPDEFTEEEFLEPEDDSEGLDDEQDEPQEDSVAKLLKHLNSTGASVVTRVKTESTSQAETPSKLISGVSGLPASIKSGLVISSMKALNSGLAVKPSASLPTGQTSLHCNKCDLDFPSFVEINEHLLKHVKLPTLKLHKVFDDNEEDDEENQANWSDEEDDQETEIPIKPKQIDSSKLQNLAGISIKKASDFVANNSPQIGKLDLSQIKNLIVKKPATAANPQKSPTEESPVLDAPSLGTLKLTIKHSSGKDNFQVVNNNHTEIKKEPVVMPPVSHPVTQAPESNKRPNFEWENIDIKDGILDQCKIKMEPTLGVNPLLGLANMESRIKSEVGSGPGSPSSPGDAIKVKSFAFEQQEKEAKIAVQPPQPVIPKPLVIPKKEPDVSSMVIEINGDDSDNDDLILVTEIPAPSEDRKPIVLPPSRGAKITELPSSPVVSAPNPSASRPSSTSTATPQYGATAKQHNFNWNAPTKSLESMLDPMKDSRDIFDSLLSGNKSSSSSDFGTSEYISLDTLGPKHTCEVCQTRFTDIRLLENHKKITGHCSTIVIANPSSSAIIPSSYSAQAGGFLLDNFLPKQLAETVSKMATNSNAGISQQNIMVNIQSFPPQGSNYMPGQQQQAGAYPGVHPHMPQSWGDMRHRMPDPSGQYGQYQGQYAPPAYGNYPGAPHQPPGMYPTQPNPSMAAQYPPAYPNNQYNPQQSYLQPNQYNPNQIPTSLPGQVPTAIHDQSGHQSPSKLGGIRIQNPQSPGQKLQPALGGRIATAIQQPRGPVKPGRGGTMMRGRGGGLRMGPRPTVRPGVQVQGQAIRGLKPGGPRPPLKRPGAPNGGPLTPTKKPMGMDGLPYIESIKGAEEPPVSISGLTVTKTRVRAPSPPVSVSKDAGAVASLLAQRGIKITAKPKSPSPPPINIPNLGSGISITKKSSTSSFHIPEETYDHNCSVCSKSFSSTSSLNLHMSQMHPNSKMAKCDSCPVSYATFQQLHDHKRHFHNAVSEMGLPVIDFSQQANLKKLSSLGIMNFLPLANREQGNGCFGIPIISVQNAMNGNLNTSLQSLGAGGLLSLGPVKPLPKF